VPKRIKQKKPLCKPRVTVVSGEEGHSTGGASLIRSNSKTRSTTRDMEESICLDGVLHEGDVERRLGTKWKSKQKEQASIWMEGKVIVKSIGI
jgi:hypothetical protein